MSEPRSETESLHETVKLSAKGIEQTHDDPNAQWPAIAHFTYPPDNLGIAPLPNLDSEEKKHKFGKILAEFIREHKVETVTLVLELWTLETTKDQIEHPELPLSNELRPSTHPDRQEMLIVETLSAHETYIDTALIERSEDAPPTLGEWKRWDGQMSGMIHSIQNALKAVANEEN